MHPSDEGVVFVVPGDLHLTSAGLPNHRAALRAVDEINGLIRPDFVQFIGDNVQDGTDEQYGLFAELRARLSVPWFAIPGDHDARGDPSAAAFRRHVGEPHGALSLRGFRFLRLNSQEGRPAGLSPARAAWFRDEVDAALGAGQRVVVFQHNYPYKVWETFDGPGLDDWRAVVQTRRIAAIFTGHTHYGQTANDGRNVVVATRSIGDPEGGPPGYTLAHVGGEGLAVTYRTIGEEAPVVLITHPREKLLATGPRHVVSGPAACLARTWWSRPLAGVEGRLDGGEPFRFEPLGPGLWGHPLPVGRLSKGEHTLGVAARDADGCEGSQAIEFMVDPTGRYTAVPSVRPVVTGTAFC
jgi:3',5'-cyclic AMP phosphodiesterase CpdA